MKNKPISRFPIPELDELPEDIRENYAGAAENRIRAFASFLRSPAVPTSSAHFSLIMMR